MEKEETKNEDLAVEAQTLMEMNSKDIVYRAKNYWFFDKTAALEAAGKGDITEFKNANIK